MNGKLLVAALMMAAHAPAASGQVEPSDTSTVARESVTVEEAMSGPPAGRLRLYSTGAIGQLTGAGVGWAAGRLLGGEECRRIEGTWCEGPGFNKEEMSKALAVFGAAVAGPAVVHHANRPHGKLLQTYFYAGIVTGFAAVVARRHEWVWYTVPVLHLAISVETEIAAQAPRRERKRR